jgi:hypothetical protein
MAWYWIVLIVMWALSISILLKEAEARIKWLGDLYDKATESHFTEISSLKRRIAALEELRNDIESHDRQLDLLSDKVYGPAYDEDDD